MKRILLTSVVFLLLPVGAAFAQAVPVEVQVIVASREGAGPVDPGIRTLVQELRRDFAYTGYRLLETHKGEVGPDHPWQTTIAGGHNLRVELIGADQRRADLKITTAGVNTRVSLHRGGPPFLVGGPPHQSGTLIISIFAH